MTGSDSQTPWLGRAMEVLGCWAPRTGGQGGSTYPRRICEEILTCPQPLPQGISGHSGVGRYGGRNRALVQKWVPY